MKALLLENIHPEAISIFANAGIEVDARPGALSEDELVMALEDVDLLGIRSRTQVSESVIARAPHSLSAIGAFCIGTNQIALQAAAMRGIAVFNAPYSNTRSVVELAMAEIVAMARHLTDKNAMLHDGIWNKSASGAHEVRGRSLGIVGYGNIGSQLSVLAEAFGMRVMFYDIADKLALGNAHRCDSLDELLADAETVTLHVDGRPGNAGLFGAREFAMMRDRALFLNLSRGFVVNTSALADAVRAGHIAGAAVDVFEIEPKGNGDRFSSPLQGVPNVILTPHIGGSTQEAQLDIGHYVANKLLEYQLSGTTAMSVNLPQVHPDSQQGRRIAHIHANVPGVLADINRLFGEHHANIAYQSLSTRSEVGYVIADITEASPGLAEELAAVPHTIRCRVL